MAELTRSRFLRNTLVGLSTALILAACAGGGGNQANAPADGSTAEGESGQTLTVATEPAFPPFESQSQTGELEGFDIDLMNAIGEEAGFQVDFEPLPFDGIIPGLQAGTVDAAISSITITSERAQTVDFTDPYIKSGLAIAVQEDNNEIQSLQDLEGKNIAVQIGTTGAMQADDIPGANVRAFDSAPLALQELANGNVDAVINDAPVTLYALKSGNIPGLKVVGELVTEEYYGIALPKNSENLEAINTALDTIIENGTYAEIYQKWFGSQPPELPENYSPQ